MILIKRLDRTLKKPKEKFVVLFTKMAEINEITDTVVQEQLSFFACRLG